MSIPRLRTHHLLLSLVLTATVACAAGSSGDPPELPAGPDARPLPLDPSGAYAVRSTFTLVATPVAVADVLAELRRATDGPDDPSRYLVELAIARLPEGQPRALAQVLAPYVAAYVNERLATVAPRLIEGLRALVAGLDRIALRFGTLEQLQIEADGGVRRTLHGLHLDGVDLPFAAHGLADSTGVTRAVFDEPWLGLHTHVTRLGHGALLRLGLDRVVIPGVVPAARDLAGALHALVDCARLGALIADRIGLGTPALYGQACTLGLTVAAAELYDRLPAVGAPPVVLEVAGSVRAVDSRWRWPRGRARGRDLVRHARRRRPRAVELRGDAPVSRGIIEIMDRHPTHTVSDYVAIEATSGLKHEYVDGQILAMGGGTLEHARLASAIIFLLQDQLGDRPCVVFTSDARVRIVATGLITYPDVSVACGPSILDVEDRLAQTNPSVLVEVTSPTTEAYDRGAKFEHYKLIPSLREYVVVSHRERAIEVFRRGDDQTWSLAARGGAGGRVALTSIGCELEVDRIYRDPRASSS